jgi:hypothetical protein
MLTNHQLAHEQKERVTPALPLPEIRLKSAFPLLQFVCEYDFLICFSLHYHQASSPHPYHGKYEQNCKMITLIDILYETATRSAVNLVAIWLRMAILRVHLLT